MTTSDHVRGRLGRRQFLNRLLLAAGGAGLTGTLWGGVGLGGRLSRALAAQGPPKAPPQPGSPPDKKNPSGITVRPDDPAITAGMVEYPGVITPLQGYLSTPKGSEVYPGVLVIHGAEGLTEHFKDITRRLARVGYVALAPDLASRAGGTATLGDQAKIAAALQGMGAGQILQDLNSSVRSLESQPLTAKSRIGTLGFGFGANLTWLIVTQNPDIKAAVVVSGNPPAPRAVLHITAAVLAIFGETERRDEDGIAQIDIAMRNAGLAWSSKVEPKAGLGFFEDTRDQYVPDAAKDAWELTTNWFAKYLSGR